jgi:hypothetical protein
MSLRILLMDVDVEKLNVILSINGHIKVDEYDEIDVELNEEDDVGHDND